MNDYWEGHRGTVEEGVLSAKDSKLPTELTVTIFAKWCDSMGNAKLEINESTLVFEVPDLYYLDLNLKYKCDQDSGKAKFDKKKKTLTVRLPVIGRTEDSQKVVDQHFQEWQEREKERHETLKQLEMSKLEEEAEARFRARKLGKKEN